MLTGKHTVPLAIIGLVVGGLTIAQALLIDWLPAQFSEQGERVDQLMWFLFWSSAIFFVLVTTVLIYCVWAFRAKPGDESEGPPIHGNTTLEIVWTVVPALLLAVVGIYSILVLNDNEALAADRTEVGVVGAQFAWSFEYEDAGFETGDLRVPVDKQVVLSIRAQDVIHSFWVNEMRVKQDAVPGNPTRLILNPTATGTYPVICAELCGAGHSVMRTRMIVMEQADYDEWLAAASADAARQPAAGSPPGAPAAAPPQAPVSGEAPAVEEAP